MSAETAIVIFAKRPVPGRVKTRLSRGPLAALGRPLSPEESAELYQAFLDDTARRMTPPPAGCELAFCLPDRPDSRFEAPLTRPPVPLRREPTRDGEAARDIGQAMAFAIAERLAAGARKVIILGSDLPHLPLAVLQEARDALDEAPLVIGDDGGGCYLVAATEVPEPFLSGEIPWSEGRDFEAIIAAQRARGRELGILRDRIDDIDGPEDLDALIARLAVEPALRDELAATTAALRRLGALSEARAMTLQINGEARESQAATLGELLRELGVALPGCAIELNEEVVPKARLDDTRIADGDRIEIVRLVGGG